jgi:hypothetical protein
VVEASQEGKGGSVSKQMKMGAALVLVGLGAWIAWKWYKGQDAATP